MKRRGRARAVEDEEMGDMGSGIPWAEGDKH